MACKAKNISYVTPYLSSLVALALESGHYCWKKLGPPRGRPTSVSRLGATFLEKPPYREKIVRERENPAQCPRRAWSVGLLW